MAPDIAAVSSVVLVLVGRREENMRSESIIGVEEVGDF